MTAGGLRIHYASAPHEPRDPAIVFLHGAGANHTVWLGQLQALREQAWVVVPDLPGHARSEPIPGLTVGEYAAALVPFLEELRAAMPADRPRRIVLAGHSMGGAIAMTIALDRPDLLAGLVIVASGAKLGVSPQIMDGLRTAPRETLALVARWSFAPDADPGLIMRSVRDLSGTPVERTIADFQACNGYDLRERVGGILAPALLLCGSEDRMTPPKSTAFLAEKMPRATVRILEGAGHSAMVEQPAAVSEAIAGFLRGLT
jgi:pimeloyl-ACP methyl ester carboxylesterase